MRKLTPLLLGVTILIGMFGAIAVVHHNNMEAELARRQRLMELQSAR